MYRHDEERRFWHTTWLGVSFVFLRWIETTEAFNSDYSPITNSVVP